MIARVLLLLLLPGTALATQAEMFGPTPARLGMANAGAALEDGAGHAILAPAAMGLTLDDQIRLQYLGGRITLEGMRDVSWTEGGDVAMPLGAIQPQGLTIDLVKTVGPWLRAGMWISLPIPYLYFHDSKDPWVPYAARWQSRYARGLGSAAASLRIPVRGVPGKGAPKAAWDDALQGGLWFGAAVSLRPRGVIDIDLDLVGLPENETEGTRIDVVLRDVDLIAKAVLRPQFSLLFDFGTLHPAVEGLRLGATWSAESHTEINPIRLDVEVLGLGELSGLFSLVERIQAEVWLGLVDFYDPHQVRIALAWDQPRYAIAVDLQWNQWSTLSPSFGRVVQGDEGEEGQLLLVIKSGEDTNELAYPVVGGRAIDQAQFRDTLDLHVGAEIRSPEWSVPGKTRPLQLTGRLGYRYQPAFALPFDGPSGLLDGDVHTVAGGLGLSGPGLGEFEPIRIDWGLQVNRLMGMDLPKTGPGLSGYGVLPVSYGPNPEWPGGWAVASNVSVGIGF